MSKFRIRSGKAKFVQLTELVQEIVGWTLKDTGIPNGHPLCNYDPPQMMVIGSVRALTTGSTSSGNKDSNSQYYW